MFKYHTSALFNIMPVNRGLLNQNQLSVAYTGRYASMDRLRYAGVVQGILGTCEVTMLICTCFMMVEGASSPKETKS